MAKHKLLQMRRCVVLSQPADLIRLNNAHLRDNSGFKRMSTCLKIPQTALTSAQCSPAGLAMARCSPIGFKTGRSNNARWILLAVHNPRFGICLRKAAHWLCGSNSVEGNTSGGQQATPDAVYWPAAEATRPTFTDKPLHTGASDHIWAAAALTSSRNTSSNGHFAVIATNKEVGRANAFSVLQYSVLSSTLWPSLWRHRR